MEKIRNNFVSDIITGSIGFLSFVIAYYYFNYGRVGLSKIIIFALPYFVTWLIFLLIAYKNTGKGIVTLRTGNLFDKNLYKVPNIYYALSLIGSFLLIMIIQYFVYSLTKNV
jgi:hypothetical protein